MQRRAFGRRDAPIAHADFNSHEVFPDVVKHNAFAFDQQRLCRDQGGTNDGECLHGCHGMFRVKVSGCEEQTHWTIVRSPTIRQRRVGGSGATAPGAANRATVSISVATCLADPRAL